MSLDGFKLPKKFPDQANPLSFPPGVCMSQDIGDINGINNYYRQYTGIVGVTQMIS